MGRGDIAKEGRLNGLGPKKKTFFAQTFYHETIFQEIFQLFFCRRRRRRCRSCGPRKIISLFRREANFVNFCSGSLRYKASGTNLCRNLSFRPPLVFHKAT